MSDVLINFVGRTDDLAPAERALDGILERSGDIGQTWRKASAEISTNTKAATTETNKLASSIDNLATASKSMDKAVIGGAYKDYLKQIQAQLGLTNKELINYIKNARAAAQQKVFTGTDQEAKEATIAIQAMNEQLAILENQSETTGTKTAFLRTQLMAAKEAFTELTHAGITSGPAFEAAEAKLKSLAKQSVDLNLITKHLGSEHPGLDGLLQLAGGVAGGFAVMQGAAALFGDSSEEVQKILLKVNAAMAILQGLQELQVVLQKNSSASLLFNTSAKQANAVATVEQTVATEGVVVAEGEQVVATEAATVAQVELNTAMELNPVGLVIVGVLALVAALSLLGGANTANEELQRRSNDALKEAGDYLEFDLKSLEHYTKKEVALAKERGATTAETAKMEGEALARKANKLKEESDNLMKEYGAQQEVFNKMFAMGSAPDDKTIEAQKKLFDRSLELDIQFQDAKNEVEVKGSEYRKMLSDAELKAFITNEETKVLATRAGSDAERSAQINEIRVTQADRIKLAKDGAASEAEATAAGNKIIAEDNRTIEGLNLSNFKHYLKGRADLFESYAVDAKAALIKNQVDSIESINKITDTQIAALKKRRDEALKSDPNLNKGETRKIVADTNLQILELEQQKNVKLLEIQKAGINAKLLLANKGSLDEYNYKIDLIDQEQKIALSATELTQQQIDEIRAKHDQQELEAYKAYQQQQIQNRISLLDAELAQDGLQEGKKLELTIRRLDEERTLEIVAAQGNAAKILEINAKTEKAILDAKRASSRVIAQLQHNATDIFSHESIVAANRALNDASLHANIEQKMQAIKVLKDFSDLKFLIDKAELDREGVSAAEYELRNSDLLNQRRDRERDIEKQITKIHDDENAKRLALLKTTFDIVQRGLDATMDNGAFKTAVSELIGLYTKIKEISDSDMDDKEKRNAIITASILTTQAVINQVFADASAKRAQALQDEIAGLEAAKQKELQAENLTAQQKNDINNRYAEKERQAKRKAWIADRDAKAAQAGINGLLGVTNALATYAWPYSLIVAAIVGGLAIAEVSQIRGAAIPNFRHGKVGIDGPGTETSDSIPANISKGESVITAKATTKWREALEAMNADNFEYFLADKIHNFIFPDVPEHLPVQGQHIDYGALAKAIASEMQGVIPAPAHVHNNMDKNGFSSFISTELGYREVVNERYTMQ